MTASLESLVILFLNFRLVRLGHVDSMFGGPVPREKLSGCSFSPCPQPMINIEMTSVGQRHTKLTFGGAKLAAFFGRGQTKKFEFDEFVMAGYRELMTLVSFEPLTRSRR
jgi:hypothetical protein